MQRINLYQDDLKRRRDAFDARRLALGSVLLAVALAATSGFQGWKARTAEAQVAALAAEREAANARIGALQAQVRAEPGGAERQRRLREELAAKRGLLRYLDEGPFAERAGFSGYLDGLADRVIEGVWLSRIDLAAGGARLQLDGHAVEARHVPELMASLGEAPAYRGRSFRRLAIDRPAEAEWRIDFVLASGPAEDKP